jgi:hypothetical protein
MRKLLFDFIGNKNRWVTLILLSCLFPAVTPSVADEQCFADYKASRYRMLDQALKARKDQLISYILEIQGKANKVREDNFCINFFKIMNAFQALKETGRLTPTSIRKTETLKEQFKEHYIFFYHYFYDVLFINPRGDIFYTIREQKDYLKNIFKPPLDETALAQKMQSVPSESFVDFQFYKISGEPSAFFIEPVQDENGLYGWIVLQFSINRINDMFAREQEMGETGEIFLVNHDHYMLTDSRFRAESTILRKQLAYENISSKFAAGKGHKEVTDYRGQKVISSFEVFDFLDSQWLLIAKMDEAEIFTQYYRGHPEALQTAVKRCLAYQPRYTPGELKFDGGLEVDMDEFKRTDTDQILYTHGIAQCTAVIIKYPGKFTYFAHISPYDRVYGETRTDLISNMLKKIEYLEITASEKQRLRFFIISPRETAFYNIVQKLLDHGYFLSQIVLMHNPVAQHANMKCTGQDNNVLVAWKMNDGRYQLERAAERESLQSQIEGLSPSEKKPPQR